MRKDATLYQNFTFMGAALITAHTFWIREGFRQRDIRFLLELFSNWMEPIFKNRILHLHNTQIQRYIEGLVGDGWAKKLGRRSRQPKYLLTKSGLLNILNQLVKRDYLGSIEEFFFLFYFVEGYGSRIAAIVESTRSSFSGSFRVDLNSLLNVDDLLSRQISLVDKEIKKLTVRIEDSEAVAEMVSQMFEKDSSEDEVILQVQNLYPYELNNQKSLTDLFRDIPADMKRWELEEASRKRAHQMWLPLKMLYVDYKKRLEDLRCIQEDV